MMNVVYVFLLFVLVESCPLTFAPEQEILFLVIGLLLGLRPANERRRYKVTPSLIGWAQT